MEKGSKIVAPQPTRWTPLAKGVTDASVAGASARNVTGPISALRSLQTASAPPSNPGRLAQGKMEESVGGGLAKLQSLQTPGPEVKPSAEPPITESSLSAPSALPTQSSPMSPPTMLSPNLLGSLYGTFVTHQKYSELLYFIARGGKERAADAVNHLQVLCAEEMAKSRNNALPKAVEQNATFYLGMYHLNQYESHSESPTQAHIEHLKEAAFFLAYAGNPNVFHLLKAEHPAQAAELMLREGGKLCTLEASNLLAHPENISVSDISTHVKTLESLGSIVNLKDPEQTIPLHQYFAAVSSLINKKCIDLLGPGNEAHQAELDNLNLEETKVLQGMRRLEEAIDRRV